jgi:hypothetical protein
MVDRTTSIDDTLEICLNRTRRGESAAACLRDYPHLAEQLAPLLAAAALARRAPQPQLNPGTRLAVQRQLRGAVAGRAPRRMAGTPWYRMAALRLAAALVIAFLALGGGVAAAQSSLPGSSLYPIKRAGEDLRLSLTFRPEQRAALHMQLARTRLEETLALLERGQPADQGALDDIARRYDLALANIKLLSAGQAQALRARFLAEGQTELDMLAAALDRATPSQRPALETAVRSGQAVLLQASETPTIPPAPAPDPTVERRPTPRPNTGSQGQNNGGTGNGQDNGQNNGGNGQDNGQNNGGNGNGQDNGQNNGGSGNGQNNGQNNGGSGNGQNNGQNNGGNGQDNGQNNGGNGQGNNGDQKSSQSTDNGGSSNPGKPDQGDKGSSKGRP